MTSVAKSEYTTVHNTVLHCTAPTFQFLFPLLFLLSILSFFSFFLFFSFLSVKIPKE